MARPKGTRPLTVDVPLDQHRWLRDHVRSERLSMAEWVRAALELSMTNPAFATAIDGQAIAAQTLHNP